MRVTSDRRPACVLVGATIILLGLLTAPLGFLAGFVGGLPNQFTAPLVEQWSLLKTLWGSNAGAALQILAQQPLMVLAYQGLAGGLPVWKLSFYPVPLLIQLFVAIFTSIVLCSADRGSMPRRLVSVLPGMAVLVFVTTYVQVAACCTGGPKWALDLWLFSLAYDPLSNLIDWQQLYLGVEGMLPVMQLALALLGMAWLAWRARIKF